MTAREAAFHHAQQRGSPSEEALPDNVRLRQKKEIPDAAFNNRPLFELEPTPIAVYEPAFARFVRKVNNKNIVPDDFEREELDIALNFIGVCSEHFKDKSERLEELAELEFLGLGYLWRERIIRGPPEPNHCTSGGLEDDLTARSHLSAFIIIGELNNGKGEGDCDASDKAQYAYIKSISSFQASIL
jgi:hypothetical protein